MSNPIRKSTRPTTVEHSRKLENILKQRENKSKERSSKKLADSLPKNLVVSYCAQSEEIIDLANPLEVPAPAESENQIIEIVRSQRIII